MLALLRVLIVVLFAVGLIVEAIYVPSAAWENAQAFPEVSYLALPYAILAIGAGACAELILVATWRLAGMVQRGRIFDAPALRWVTLMVNSAIVATVLVSVVAIDATFFEDLGPATLSLIGATIGVGAVTLILMVMRDLLTTAVQHKAELDEVV